MNAKEQKWSEEAQKYNEKLLSEWEEQPKPPTQEEINASLMLEIAKLKVKVKK